MALKGKQVEELWGRLERQLTEHTFECALLNEPHQDLGIHARDRVAVGVGVMQGRLIAQCLGPMSEIKDKPDA
ncbi:MAG: hypothetical protein IPK19_18515 [Chloroflexi bacterium]|nr:hypothetical protein [Chloroflexota bacterium]